MLIGSNPKNNEDPVAFFGGNSRVWILFMVFPAMWKLCGCQKTCGFYEWEFTVNSCPRTDKYKCSSNCELPISHFPNSHFATQHNLIHRETGTMSYHCSHRSFFAATGEGAKHLFLLCEKRLWEEISLCEKRHFTTVRNHLRLLRTVWLPYSILDNKTTFLLNIFT